jgi:hypothetical protein
MDPAQRLLILEATLGGQVAEVLDCGLVVEPAGGTSAAWDALRARLGVPAEAEETRYPAARAAGQTRGAPIAEVRACLARLVDETRGALGGIGEIGAADRARLDAFLVRLVDEVAEHYQKKTCEKPRGMFAHVRATANKHQYSGVKATAYVLRCPTCGGPRLKPEHFQCSYCGGKFTD